jgi:hydrogenase maturation protease
LSASPKSARILVIGYGNTLRQDDGVGPRVADALLERVTDERVEILTRASLTPELAETISGLDTVVFVDASAELAPGAVEARDVVRSDSADMALVHFLAPEALLSWSHDLFGRCPEGRVWLVGVERTELGEELSAVVEPCVARIAVEIEDYLARRLARLETS